MKIAIIGGGASGLFLATLLEKLNIDYVIFNKGKVGSKILASGNGRCNISNLEYDDEFYHNNELSKIVYYNQGHLFDILRDLKIYTKADDEGRMYPISESSLSVLNILLKHIKHEIIIEEIKTIKKDNNKYYLNNTYGPFDKLVLATGSPASFKSFNCDYLNSLDIKFNQFKPSLVGFKTNLDFKKIKGSRAKALTYLYNDNKLIHKEYGEVMFKEDGISGIVIMNQSSYYNYIDNKKNVKIIIDLLDKDYDDLESVIQPKLLEYILNNKINPHKFEIPVIGTYSFEFAQVAKGGIAIESINKNLSLKKDKNIYVTGELLDIDGVCGGFNLMNAFCDSIEVYKDLKNEISNK